MLGLTLQDITLQDTRFYQEAKEEGRQEGQRSLVLQQLKRRVGVLPEPCVQQIEQLSLDQLETLGEALLDFVAISDLKTWLEDSSVP